MGGFLRAAFNTAVLGGAGALGGWTFWTRNSRFVPMSNNDPILTSPAFLQNNPTSNPVMHDLCVRKVPLSKIKPQLLEEGEGKLTTAFCAGLWGGWGELLLVCLLTGREKREGKANILVP
jgi:hypothetical protein